MDTLVLVLGDQLSHRSPAFDGLDAASATVLMIEAPGEATHVRSHKARIALFLSAMRHFRDELRGRGWRVDYVELDRPGEPPGLPERLAATLERLRPRCLRLVEPGEWRLRRRIARAAAAAGVELQLLEDDHFMCSRGEFASRAGRPGAPLRMEPFYRRMRSAHGVLLDGGGEPEGGGWNFDADNRKGWPKAPPHRAGPGLVAPPESFPPDAITREVIGLVEARFAGHPGSLADFAWPVERAQAVRALEVFVATRLAEFGRHQDAMWTATPFGWHALLSSSLNLHLLDPREVIAAAEQAYRSGAAPLAGVEGFVRQVLGWREFIHGVYWQDMPQLSGANHFAVREPLPAWYWSGETNMNCAREAVGQTLRYGFAHHIQRLMVTGLFALLAEVKPRHVADWYLAIYVDAVEWAELPNVIGMALHADGGRFTSKPYLASGTYIDRMSNYCDGCLYAPSEASAAQRGKPLCPFTVLYWNFVERRAGFLRANPRTEFMVRNLERRPKAERAGLRRQATALFGRIDAL